MKIGLQFDEPIENSQIMNQICHMEFMEKLVYNFK